MMRVIGAASGAGGAFAASAAGRNDIAIGLLALTALTLAGHLTAAVLRDQRFGKIASEPKADPGVLRELNIREAIRGGQLSSRDAAIVLIKDLSAEQFQQSQYRQDQSLADPAITDWQQ